MEKAIHTFSSLLTSINPELGKTELNYILQHCQVKTTLNRDIIIRENKIQTHIFFLVLGLARGYYVNEKGEEITTRLINSSGWITHYSALISNTESKYTFQTLEQSEIISLPYSIIQEGYKKHKGLERFGRLIAENVLINQQARIESFQFLNAEQRYLAFIENNPELFNRVSLSHLSTYLGIKRQSLTRIRKKLAGH